MFVVLYMFQVWTCSWMAVNLSPLLVALWIIYPASWQDNAIDYGILTYYQRVNRNLILSSKESAHLITHTKSGSIETVNILQPLWHPDTLMTQWPAMIMAEGVAATNYTCLKCTPLTVLSLSPLPIYQQLLQSHIASAIHTQQKVDHFTFCVYLSGALSS